MKQDFKSNFSDTLTLIYIVGSGGVSSEFANSCYVVYIELFFAQSPRPDFSEAEFLES